VTIGAPRSASTSAASWQGTHSATRFRGSSPPPAVRGMTWAAQAPPEPARPPGRGGHEGSEPFPLQCSAQDLTRTRRLTVIAQFFSSFLAFRCAARRSVADGRGPAARPRWRQVWAEFYECARVPCLARPGCGLGPDARWGRRVVLHGSPREAAGRVVRSGVELRTPSRPCVRLTRRAARRRSSCPFGDTAPPAAAASRTARRAAVTFRCQGGREILDSDD